MAELLKNQTPEANKTAERIGLPTGFVTEKGSVYTYNPNGTVHRDKYDGTSHESGISVFIDDSPKAQDILTRLGTIQNHLPPEKQKKAYILETEEKDGQVFVKGKVYKAYQVEDPSRLAFALINGNGEVVDWTPVSIYPKIGSHVFEMDKLPDGSTSRHPGHRVTDIVQ